MWPIIRIFRAPITISIGGVQGGVTWMEIRELVVISNWTFWRGNTLTSTNRYNMRENRQISTLIIVHNKTTLKTHLTD